MANAGGQARLFMGSDEFIILSSIPFSVKAAFVTGNCCLPWYYYLGRRLQLLALGQLFLSASLTQTLRELMSSFHRYITSLYWGKRGNFCEINLPVLGFEPLNLWRDAHLNSHESGHGLVQASSVTFVWEGLRMRRPCLVTVKICAILYPSHLAIFFICIPFQIFMWQQTVTYNP